RLSVDNVGIACLLDRRRWSSGSGPLWACGQLGSEPLEEQVDHAVFLGVQPPPWTTADIGGDQPSPSEDGLLHLDDQLDMLHPRRQERQHATMQLVEGVHVAGEVVLPELDVQLDEGAAGLDADRAATQRV